MKIRETDWNEDDDREISDRPRGKKQVLRKPPGLLRNGKRETS